MSGRSSRRRHLWLGVPVVITTTGIGSTIFVTLQSDSNDRVKWATGLLSFVAGVLAALQTFFNFSEQAERHRTVAAKWANIYRRLGQYQLNYPETYDDRSSALSALNLILNDMEQVENESPDVQDRFYDQAVAEDKSDLDGI